MELCGEAAGESIFAKADVAGFGTAKKSGLPKKVGETGPEHP
jgi:hypothetical protein